MTSVEISTTEMESRLGVRAGDPRSKPARRWFRWHAWLGFKLSILMFVICLTGTLATISNELDWMLNPLLRVEAVDAPIRWQAIRENFARHYQGSTLNYLESPLYPSFSIVGSMVTEEGVLRRVFFDPYSGEVKGDLPWPASVQRMLRDLHRFLLFPVSFGADLVSSLGFVLFASIISALFVYKKWWRGFFKLRRSHGRRIYYGDLHRLLGVWSLLFLFVIALTGMWYFVERMSNALDIRLRAPAVNVSMSVNSSAGELAEFVSLDRVVAAAQAALPELQIKYVNLPQKSADQLRPFLISGRSSALLTRADASRVFVNPFDAQVLEVVRAEEMSLGNRLISAADPLHFGDFGGLATKLLYFLFGIATLLMSLTGAWMWIRRNRRLQTKGLVYSFMGWWKEVSIFVVMLGLSWGLYMIFTYQQLFI